MTIEQDVFFTQKEVTDAIAAMMVSKGMIEAEAYLSCDVTFRAAPVVKGGKRFDFVMGLKTTESVTEPTAA